MYETISIVFYLKPTERAAIQQEAARKAQEAAAAVQALTRQPSLSTIQEERTSQLQEVSFSFDGKEVSVSLYETPDLTEEEALQIVEMYAEELSEHVSGSLYDYCFYPQCFQYFTKNTLIYAT